MKKAAITLIVLLLFFAGCGADLSKKQSVEATDKEGINAVLEAVLTCPNDNLYTASNEVIISGMTDVGMSEEEYEEEYRKEKAAWTDCIGEYVAEARIDSFMKQWERVAFLSRAAVTDDIVEPSDIMHSDDDDNVRIVAASIHVTTTDGSTHDYITKWRFVLDDDGLIQQMELLDDDGYLTIDNS